MRVSIMLLVLSACCHLQAQEEETRALEALKGAGLAADDKALLEFLRTRSTTGEDVMRLASLVRQLGDDAFEQREKASRELTLSGRKAVPFLRKALTDPDAEIVRRARDCLDRIESGSEQETIVAVLTLLKSRRPAGTVETVLGYLPQADDDLVKEIIHDVLLQTAVREGKVEPALVKAVGDRSAVCRAAAGRTLALQAPQLHDKVRTLLRDPEPVVRFHTAHSLAHAGDRQAITTLIDLLGNGPMEQAFLSEDLLFRLGGEKSPALTLAGQAAVDRTKCRDAWLAWWKENGKGIDLKKVLSASEVLGITLCCELQGGKQGSGRVFEYGPDRKIKWEFDDVRAPIDVQRTSRGTILVAEINSNEVTERDRTGKVLFRKTFADSPMVAQPLPNGNIFVGTYKELTEITRTGKVIYSHPVNHGTIHYAQKLPNGHIFYVGTDKLIVEVDSATGKEIRTIDAGDTSNWSSVERLPNGHFLICRCSLHQVVELNAAGKEVWTHTIEWPTWAGRLPNGHTLIACAHSGQVTQVTREGKQVWHEKLENRPCRFRRY